MSPLFFLLEHNLYPLQKELRTLVASTFLPADKEIGLSMKSTYPEIVAKVQQQKTDLGINRIIITKDKLFCTHLGKADVQLIVLVDKNIIFKLSRLNLKKLAAKIISEALILNTIKGQTYTFIDISPFY